MHLDNAYKNSLDIFRFSLVCLLIVKENEFATQVPNVPWSGIAGKELILKMGGGALTAFSVFMPFFMVSCNFTLLFLGCGIVLQI
jgi:hypothetical protein